ncbi:fatty acid alpha-hydroxylase [Haplosporangium sp. Z 767]|nr:fatty acid alpha-hydroxylase [Haplosporangium sp. Z 767]KAF9196490.1 fatty acid alpha-hydroxylase [Haplosporangium sp. Z 11]
MTLQTFTMQQVQAQKSKDSCWVVHNNKVYDVASFVQDHPGGEEYILDHAGQDITALMKDELEHLHSEGAYEMLDEFLIGSLVSPTQQSTNDTDVPPLAPGLHQRKPNASVATTLTDLEIDEDYLKPTDLNADKKNKFLDLSQPLLWQLWKSNYSKAFYLEQVHIPRHLPGSARIFASPFLEIFSKTPWYVIPIFWLPIIVYNANRSLESGLSTNQLSINFVFGMFLWTLAEYILHRFLFHVDDSLPDSNIWLVAHFLLHGIHHYIPMDRLRLVMPPALGVALAVPLYKLAHTLFPTPQAYAIMSGAFLGYVLYDMTHYYLHHSKVFRIYFKKMKTYHLAHHYKNYEAGYGITSVLFDKIFGTELQI